MNRRSILKGLGAATLVIAGGGAWRAHDQGVLAARGGAAYEPWDNWNGIPEDDPLAIVRAGILAASPHNTQPWIFNVTDAAIDLHADCSRNLGQLDPFLREMYLGLGCALENMALAARAGGYAFRIVPVPGDLAAVDDPAGLVRVARMELKPGDRESTRLHRAIPDRHTNRGPYDVSRAVPESALDAMRTMAAGASGARLIVINDDKDREDCGELIVQATEAIIADREMIHDSQSWFRHSYDAIQEHRDGVTLDAAGMSPLMATAAKMLPPPSAETSHQYWLQATRDVHTGTAAAYGFIAVRDLYDRARALEAGALWQRLHLWATREGLAMQPLNQPVEMVDRDRVLGKDPRTSVKLSRLTGSAAWKPTFAFRMGYPERAAAASPRRPVDSVLGPGS